MGGGKTNEDKESPLSLVDVCRGQEASVLITTRCLMDSIDRYAIFSHKTIPKIHK